MLGHGNFCRKQTDHKPRVNKKQNIEIDSLASRKGQGKYTKYVSVPWSPLEAALSISNLGFLLKYNI
jgi:hypothetical protein